MHFWSSLFVHEFLPAQQNKLKLTPLGTNICILCRKYNIFDIHNATGSYFEFASNIGLHFIIKNHKPINEIKNISVKCNNLCLKQHKINLIYTRLCELTVNFRIFHALWGVFLGPPELARVIQDAPCSPPCTTQSEITTAPLIQAEFHIAHILGHLSSGSSLQTRVLPQDHSHHDCSTIMMWLTWRFKERVRVACCSQEINAEFQTPGLILGLRPANERRRYFVTP